MTLADFPQIQALTPREKLQLADELWIEITQQADSLDLDAEEKRLLDDRWASFTANPSSALTLDELKERVNALRAG